MANANTRKQSPQGKDFRLLAKSALLERNMTITGLSHELKLARNTVSIAINHSTMLPTVKRRIAQHLKLAA